MIAVQATDIAGNAHTANITVTFVRIPLVTITSPANLSFFNVSPITVRGTVDDPNATVQVNGISVATSGGTFTAQILAGGK